MKTNVKLNECSCGHGSVHCETVIHQDAKGVHTACSIRCKNCMQETHVHDSMFQAAQEWNAMNSPAPEQKTNPAAPMNGKVQHHKAVCEELNKIYAQKNHDYGDSFHKTFMEEGFAMARIRLSDKLNRFCALTKAGAEQRVKDESVKDTLMDLANYAVMTVLEMEEQA